VTLIGVRKITPSSSIIGKVGRIGHDDDQEPAFATMRHEPVPQHQIGRDRSEEILIDSELLHVDELEPIALGQHPRTGEFLGVFLRIRQILADAVAISRTYVPTTEVNSKSGRYNARTTAAMMIPMKTSIAGSISLVTRSTSVSTSSS
jgi:hypothetical protein